MSKDRVVVAADSRSTTGRGEYFDNTCKVLAMGNKLVFVSVGALAFRPGPPLDVGWSADQEARLAFHTFELERARAQAGLVNEVTATWGSAMLSNLTRMPRDPTWAEGEVIARGLFAGIEADEEILFGLVQLTYQPRQPGRFITTTEFLPLRNEETRFKAFGKTEIVEEFLDRLTPRSQSEALRWKEELAVRKPEDRDLLTAIRLVDLTLAYLPRPDSVGGEIDAVELSREGIHWKQRKNNCQDFEQSNGMHWNPPR